MNSDRSVADILLRVGAVKLAEDKPFVFTSGLISPIYCDNRILMGFPEERDEIVSLYIDLMVSQIGLSSIDVIAATATSAIPFAAWIAHELNLPMVYVRPEPKKHGQKKQVEGPLAAGARAVLIEDHISTGGSALRSVEALRAEGATCDDCIAIFGYNVAASRQHFETSRINLGVLCDFSALLEVARQRMMLDEPKIVEMREWAQVNFG